MKIIFMGTPEFSVPVLKKIEEKGHHVVCVVTQPDKKVGRKQTPTASPVKTYAKSKGIFIHQPIKLKDDYEMLLKMDADLIVTAAYGQMLPKALLERIDAINVHASLLPKYRGGAPIQYALFNQDKITGITIMYMAPKMDSGDIIYQEKCYIHEEDNYKTLSEKLSALGAIALEKVLDEFSQQKPKGIPQNEKEVTFAYALKREDEMIDFNHTCDHILGRIRGLSPHIGAFFEIKGVCVKVFLARKSDIIKQGEAGYVQENHKQLLIQAQDGLISLEEIQIPGKKKMAIKDYLNGQTLFQIGDIIGK